ncbi:DUF1801 domain-containing protein [Terricaulis sp.]|uniref:DUF1801 domain-containing protein n=1 Tax=Terricaulis sp. TaxID=2768686 RepID=UPI003783C73B
MPAARKTSAKKAPGKKAAPARNDAAVEAYLKALDHPLKKEIAAVRLIILGVSPKISDGIKWNVPSFATSDYFATFNVRAKERVELIFHFGAKAKGISVEGKIPDPAGLLKWLAKDRAMVTLGAGRDIAANRKAFEALVRAWIKLL